MLIPPSFVQVVGPKGPPGPMVNIPPPVYSKPPTKQNTLIIVHVVYDNTAINVGEHTVLNIFCFQGPPGEQGPRGEAGLKGDKVGSHITH